IRFMSQTLDWPGPIYIRLAKGFDPIVSRDDSPFQIGKAILMRKAATEFDRVLLVSTGVATTRTLRAAELLAHGGVDTTVLHVHTLKPIDVDALVLHSRGARLLVTVEEHTLMGGLGTAVTEALVDRMVPNLPAIKRLGIADVFATKYGNQDDLME